jgi:hypothetical protein
VRYFVPYALSFLSSTYLQFKYWPSVVPILQSMINNQPADRLKGMAPVTAMTALPASTPLLSIISPLLGVEVLTLDQIAAELAANLQAIQNSLDNLHRATADGAGYKRRKRRSNKNAATAATLPNFALGDFVLVGSIAGTHGHNLGVKWRGPRRIIAVESDWVHQIQDLLTNNSTAVHASHLKFYCDDMRLGPRHRTASLWPALLVSTTTSSHQE